MRVATKEHFFLNRHVKKQQTTTTTKKTTWYYRISNLKLGKNKKRPDVCGFMLPCPQTHLTHCVALFPCVTNFMKISRICQKFSWQGLLCGGEAGNLCYADEGFKKKSSYNGVILGGLSKILQSSSFIGLHLVPCGCSVSPAFMGSGYE